MGRKIPLEVDENENEYDEEEKIYPQFYPTIQRKYSDEIVKPTTSYNEKTYYNEKASAPIELNRMNEFLLEKKKLEERLTHYKKIKKRWTKADSIVKISCVSLAGSLTVATSIVGGLTPIILGATAGIITGVMGGVGAVQLFLGEGVSIGVTSKKKKIYREICEQLELGINKLYLFQVKALEDKVLTTEEIEECQRIIIEINEKIDRIKNGKK